MDGFQVGPVKIETPVVLAPMEGITDRAFRTTIRSLGGCGLAVTEFVSSEGLTRDVKDAWRMAELDPSEDPVSIQIYGRNPERMAEAALYCEQLGADIVDINLGCPSKRVTSGCSGSALMREPELAHDIFVAVNEVLSVPMTVKMRLGWNEEMLNAAEVAADAVACGAKMIVVHGRTREQGYKGNSRWDEIAPVKPAIGDIPLLVNGDVVDYDTAMRAMEASNADGVMVGRGVMKNPWALRDITAAMRGRSVQTPDSAEKAQVLRTYLEKLAMDGPANKRSLVKLKKVVGYFTKGMYNASRLRKAIQRVQSYEEAESLIDSFFLKDKPGDGFQKRMREAQVA
jgi:tRNA-dihydrouridine synthase B